MIIPFSKKAIKPGYILIRDVCGESLLLTLETENYYGVDEVGTRMWEVLTTSSSIQTAYDILLTEYDITPDALKQDITRLIEELVEQGLLELSDG